MRVQLTDKGMEHLRGLHHLSKLILSDVQVKNSGLGQLRGMTRLTSLTIRRGLLDDLKALPRLTEVRVLNLATNLLTDDAISPITNLPGLQDLDLSQNFVTNSCLETLARLPRLTMVNIRDTRISHEAVKEFQKSHPQVMIKRRTLQPITVEMP